MLNLNKEYNNIPYDIFELFKLTFKLLNKNMDKVLGYFIKVILALIVVLIPSIIMFVSFDVLAYDIFNPAKKSEGINQILNPLLSISIAMVFIVTILLFLAFAFVVTWFRVSAVVSIDTGIKSIESKKVNVTAMYTFPKMFVIQVLVFVVYLIISTLSYKKSNFFLVTIQVQIVAFFIGNCAMFSYFEIVAKGKSISNAASNAFINLFFSENNIIVKSFVGELIIGIVVFVVMSFVIFFDVFIIMICLAMQSYVLGVIIVITLTTICFMLLGYCTFFGTTYNYLIYMLNEVKNYKVDKLL